ncbi:metallophosphoesterase [Pyrobaculum aerophilum]|uniref:Metallophosphoesterase n=1 Tax=Pyrobaculum aerophilum TaxID=13773 RepID=A0A371R1V3_9CREN|nr:metallophosphoesterase [Pyrobaculum aerophilum]RFA97519.1 metallophosphoesterase [Pyrobaculum aerophilum]
MYRRALLTMALGLGALAAAGVAVVNTATRILDLGLGRRIVFISDLHLHRVEKYDLPSYDLLLIGGDTYDRNTPGPHVVVETLSQLRGPKVAVLGNHEYWDMRRIPLREGLKALEEAGVHVLRDDWVQIGGLRIYGLDWREDPRAYPAVKDADIVLVHSPDAFQNAVNGLYLAGHTHGGQFCLPGGVPLITNSHFGYTYGLYRRGNAVMYVTRGLGEILPRVWCDREVVILS